MPVKKQQENLEKCKMQIHVVLVLVQLSCACTADSDPTRGNQVGWNCEGRKSTLWMGGFDWHKATA